MKKILTTILALSIASFTSMAEAQITIGKKNITTTDGGFKTDNYYTVVVSATDNSASNITAFTFFIPNEIFANGTYDLEYLPPEANSLDEAVQQCEEEQESGDDTVTLPSNDKVYVLGNMAKIKTQGKFIKGKGIALIDKGFGSQQVTISGIGSAITSPLIEEVTLSVAQTKLPFTKFNYKIRVTEDCQELAKKSKFKVSKKAKKTKFAVSATATVITTTIPSGF